MTKHREAILCMLVAALFFCLTEVCMKKINGDLNGVQVNATRYTLAGLALMPWSRKQLLARHARVTFAQQKLCFFLGFMGIAMVGPLYQMASVVLGASHTAVIFSSTPLFITVLAALILGTPITRYEIAPPGGSRCLAIAVLVDPFHMSLDPGGFLGLMVCVFGYSLYAVGGKKLMPALGSVTVTAWTFLWGGLQLLWPSCPTSPLWRPFSLPTAWEIMPISLFLPATPGPTCPGCSPCIWASLWWLSCAGSGPWRWGASPWGA